VSQPFIGEIRMFAGSFAPQGWAFCDGQLLAIAENDALFQLIGTTYGGDGQNTFALPDLRSRIPVHAGTGPGGTAYQLGQAGGAESVTLTANQIPAHSHALNADENSGTQLSPTNNVLAQTANPQMYRAITPNLAMNANSIQQAGGNQPHDNMTPFLVVSFIISLFGIFPTQS
jgi:microcystin-dependent protein